MGAGSPEALRTTRAPANTRPTLTRTSGFHWFPLVSTGFQSFRLGRCQETFKSSPGICQKPLKSILFWRDWTGEAGSGWGPLYAGAEIVLEGPFHISCFRLLSRNVGRSGVCF